MIRQQVLDSVDLFVALAVFIILGSGLITLYSVTHSTPFSWTVMPLYLKQLIWILLGIVVFLVFVAIDYHTLARFAYPLYGITLFLLLVVSFTSPSIYGAKRWISFGFFSLQPSELAKISLLLVLARHLSNNPWNADTQLNLVRLIFPLGLLLCPLMLVLGQPDLGTALALAAIFLCMIAVRGVRSKFLIYFSLLFFMLAPFIGQLLWSNLKGYQRERIETFLNPLEDPSGSGWHILQSTIAIGSGGVWGKGLGEGTQSQLQFLPKSPTDFIFSVFSETWGFVGVLILFSLFIFLFWWITDVARQAKDLLGVLMAMGVMGMIAYHFLVNVGMSIGVLPVVGVPLPLMSYGGSSMVVHLGLLGLLVNIKIRRFMLFY